jgi:FixJ family two-component response regulator
MTIDIQEQKTRRLDILDGISKGLGNNKIASKLGIPLWVVRAHAMESTLEDKGGVKLDKRIKLLQKLKIKVEDTASRTCTCWRRTKRRLENTNSSIHV